MSLQRPTRIIFAVLAAAFLITGGILLIPPQSKPKLLSPSNPTRLTPAPAASGAPISASFTASVLTPAEPPRTPPGGTLPLPAPPTEPDSLADDTVVKLRELAEADPAALAESALNQPASHLRERMLLEALPLWAERDPSATAKWVSLQKPSREFDLGIDAVVRHPATLTLSPTIVLGLASDIIDGSLRLSALRSVIQTRFHHDADQLRTALEQATDLTSTDRTTLLSELTDLTAAH